MPTLTMLRGLPASGKSTFAMKMVTNNPKTVRVCRNDLREMMFPKYMWNFNKEQIVTEAQDSAVSSALHRGYNVVVDNTNLDTKYYTKWENTAREFDAQFEVIDFNEKIDHLIIRDDDRSPNHRVGRDVILNLAYKYGYATTMAPYVIFSLDGTLANIDKRLSLATTGYDNRGNRKLDWDVFFDPDNIRLDVPTPIFKNLASALDDGMSVVIVTGRSDITRSVTEEWLIDSFNRYNKRGGGRFWDRLIMRSNGDYTKEYVLKNMFLEKYLVKEQCKMVYESRPEIIQMWERHGLPVVKVNNGGLV